MREAWIKSIARCCDDVSVGKEELSRNEVGEHYAKPVILVDDLGPGANKRVVNPEINRDGSIAKPDRRPSHWASIGSRNTSSRGSWLRPGAMRCELVLR